MQMAAEQLTAEQLAIITRKSPLTLQCLHLTTARAVT